MMIIICKSFGSGSNRFSYGGAVQEAILMSLYGKYRIICQAAWIIWIVMAFVGPTPHQSNPFLWKMFPY
jgi:hypothetical protein